MPDRARPWSGDPPPRHLTSYYDRLRQALRRPLEPGFDDVVNVMTPVSTVTGPAPITGTMVKDPSATTGWALAGWVVNAVAAASAAPATYTLTFLISNLSLGRGLQ